MEIQKQLIKTAVTDSITSGKAILDIYHSNFTVELKKDKSPITNADKKSNEIITEILKKLIYISLLSVRKVSV